MGVLFGLWPRFWFVLVLFCFCLVSAGETQIWLGDLRVVAFCVVVFFVVCFNRSADFKDLCPCTMF